MSRLVGALGEFEEPLGEPSGVTEVSDLVEIVDSYLKDLQLVLAAESLSGHDPA